MQLTTGGNLGAPFPKMSLCNCLLESHKSICQPALKFQFSRQLTVLRDNYIRSFHWTLSFCFVGLSGPPGMMSSSRIIMFLSHRQEQHSRKNSHCFCTVRKAFKRTPMDLLVFSRRHISSKPREFYIPTKYLVLQTPAWKIWFIFKDLDRWDEWHPLRNALTFWVTLIGNGTWNINFKFSAVAKAIFSPNS